MNKNISLLRGGLMLLCWATGHARADLINNPSFENNSASGTMFNMTNVIASSTIADFTAFGTGLGEIDLSTSGFLGDPQDGSWFVTLHHNPGISTGIDAFSLDLSSPLILGQTYDLGFFATGLEERPTGVEIGVSTSATDFGTLVFTSNAYPADINSWTNLSTTFSAPTAAQFLTVRASSSVSNAIASVDNFNLTAIPEPSSFALLTLAGSIVYTRGNRKQQTNAPSGHR